MKTKDKPWVCNECGKRMSLKTAEKMECPKCGGADIDLDPAAFAAEFSKKAVTR